MAAHLRATPSQTVGPFFEFGLLRPPQPEIVPPDTPGAVRIEGRVLDGQRNPVPDAMIEIWQAAPSGRYAHPDDTRYDLPLPPHFTGFGRAGTDASGGVGGPGSAHLRHRAPRWVCHPDTIGETR